MEDNPGISLFQPGNLQIENDLQNLEEAEDIEDQRRLQGEMQNLFTNALDDFNFDDQSTFNSSTNASPEQSIGTSLYLKEKFKNAGFDEQLKVLYEARVREVRTLQEQLEKQRKDSGYERDDIARKYLLSEANKDKAEISLKQAAEIIVDKTALLSKVTSENNDLKNAFESLQKDLAVLIDENGLLKNINQDILEQKDLIQKGFNKNSVSERMLEEVHSQEIKQLRNNLEGMNSRLQRKELDNEELLQKYKKLNREKDDLVIEKSGHINSLSDHLQSAQKQCRDLIQVIEQLTEENDRLKKSPSNISESIRLMGLKDQSDMINALHKELEKIKNSQLKQLMQYELLQKQYSEKMKECNSLKGELVKIHTEFEASKKLATPKMDSGNHFVDESIYKEHMKILQDENNLLNDKIISFENQIEHLKELEETNMTLKDKVNLLEAQLKSAENIRKDNSLRNELETEKNNIQFHLEKAKTTIQELEEKILGYENQIETFELKIKLQGEREDLIKDLQEKAALFQLYLDQKKDLEKETTSIGINTEILNEVKVEVKSDNEEVFKEKYEAELITKEINLREELQKEFTEKLEKYAQELTTKAKSVSPNNSIDSCRKCERKDNKLGEMESALITSIQQIKKIAKERSDDREAISKLLNHWKESFEDMEKQKIIVANKLIISEDRIRELEKILHIRENGDAELLVRLKNEVETAIQSYNKKVLTDVSNMAKNQVKIVTDIHTKIDEINISTEKQVNS